MTNPTKINDLTPASAVTSNMQLETDIGGTTANKITVDQLNTYIKSTNSLFCVAATGTVDAIAATYTPTVVLYNTLLVAFVSTGVNTTTTPTFAYNSGTARTITARGGIALRPGDIGAAGYVGILEYNLANTRWELLNPVNANGLFCIAGGGTVDAITATYNPTVALYDTLTCSFVSTGVNVTTTPTFAYNSGTARTITARGGLPLKPGDIGAAGYVGFLEYNLANTRWELLNPVNGNGILCVAAGGAVDAITATYTPTIGLYDTLMCSFVSAGVNITTTPTFAYNGGTARTITGRGGLALLPGDIGAAGYVGLLEYNLANTRWELLNPVNANAALCVAAGGTVDAITATYTPTVALYNTLICHFVSAGVNVTATPTFAYNGGTARTITARGGQVLRPGDIGAAGYVGILEYNLANTRWELLNPVNATSLSVSNSTVNNVSTGETDLITYAMPASVFSNPGARLRYRVRGAFASSANAKTLKIYFGTTVITSQSLPVNVAGTYTAVIDITRTGTSAQSISFEVLRNGTAAVPGFTAPAIVPATETESAIITLKCTGTGGASSEISQYYSSVDIL